MIMITKWKASVRELMAIILIITRGRITLGAIALMTALYSWHREAPPASNSCFCSAVHGVTHLPLFVLKMALMTPLGKSEGNLVKSKKCASYSCGFLVAWKELMRLH